MIGDSLNIETLQPILEAMDKVKEIDRSDYFNQYYKEVEERIKEAQELNKFIIK